MEASLFNLDGNELSYGQYSPTTKSLYRAAIDAMKIFNGDSFTISRNFAVVKVGNGRVVIGR